MRRREKQTREQIYREKLLRAREGEQRTGEESLAAGEDLVVDFGRREEIFFFWEAPGV